MKKSDVTEHMLAAATTMVEKLDQLSFAPPVEYVYNPLVYVWDGYKQFVTRYARKNIRALFVGMNPGPWGMAQSGVPFGEVNIVREWLGIVPEYDQPQQAHPLRPIDGVSCRRSEVSGARLWGLFQQRYETPAKCFAELFVANYCPLAFMESSARNRTPDKLPAAERDSLFQICDEHLAAMVKILEPRWVVGVGLFAEQRARAALKDNPSLGSDLEIVKILHPSPASPASNKDWAGLATKQLIAAGVW